ncbi:hypothetical protein M9H77_06175 [Catharanthus roseus]|uniref:Uncharacterized protein n=1 Tax=Catharanthus roseus TaxID=4058 RepID=A0ACC0BRH7_CATRO|nr:hypothetical protein M9H77_06175 [Catharanthus roseus]
MAIAFILIHLLLQSNLALSQNNGNVTVGTSLSADEKGARWLSPSGDFAFGFFQQQDQDSFLLSIWYDKIPEKTIVWYANGDDLSPRGSKLNLTSDRGLVLISPQGEEKLISDPIIGSVAFGSMKDTGNFVLENTNSESLWESFNQSTDTILPGQTFVRGSTLSSRRTEANFSRGRFQLNLLRNGKLELSTINIPSTYKNVEPYYSNGTGDNSASSIYQMVFNQSAFIFLRRNDGQEVVLSQGELGQTTSFYHRATLSFDGVFTHFRHPKNGNGGWSAIWSIPENICLHIPMAKGSGICGFNRICRLTNDKRPDCQCPRPFSLVDPNDEYRGCIPEFLQSCNENEQDSKDEYYFNNLTNIDWPTSDYEQLQPYEEDDCTSSCLNDCMCAVAIFRNNTCYKKKLPLSNGRIDSSLNGKALIKMRKSNYVPIDNNSSGNGKKSQSTLVILISVFLGSSVFVNFVLIGVIFLGFLLIYQNKLGRNGKGEDVLHRNLRCFTYKELENATNGFKEELGRGSFGIVYKGSINQAGTTNLVAVKKLDRFIQEGDTEFRTEVNVIGQTHHKNLVRLLGFCAEGSNRLLVYEFMKNGTLSQFLFGDLKLTWIQRTQIAVGIAKGLVYLHEECSTQIIHCDIKPQNILLDDFYSPRISDFGLAKLLRIDQSDSEAIDDLKRLERFLMVAIWCIQEDPHLRPNMKKVVLMLEGIVEVLVPPCPSPYSTLGKN